MYTNTTTYNDNNKNKLFLGFYNNNNNKNKLSRLHKAIENEPMIILHCFILKVYHSIFFTAQRFLVK